MEFFKMRFMVERNIKLYFKDKLIFFVSLITPLILVFLFLAFLRGVYEDSLISIVEGFTLDKSLINGFTGGWLFSSIMATSCITVAFCSNMMVDDKIKNMYQGFSVAPVKKSTLQLSYVISNFFTTLIVCSVLLVISLVYLAIVGWALSFVDILLIIADMLLSIAFGTLLMSFISMFINSQGAHSAVCTLISSMYGFLCGAYMPLSQMGKGMSGFVSFIPGTYGTVIFRNGYLRGVLEKIDKVVPAEMTKGIKDGFDYNFSFFGHNVPVWAMFIIMIVSVLVLLGAFILVANFYHHGKAKKKLKRGKNN